MPRRKRKKRVKDTETALAHPDRRRIVDVLNEMGSMPSTVISEKLGLDLQVGSSHLVVLRDTGLARIDYRGTTRIYSLDDEAVLEATRWQAELHGFAERRLAAASPGSGPGDG